jgi:hypothetical protein
MDPCKHYPQREVLRRDGLCALKLFRGSMLFGMSNDCLRAIENSESNRDAQLVRKWQYSRGVPLGKRQADVRVPAQVRMHFGFRYARVEHQESGKPDKCSKHHGTKKYAHI